MPFLNNYIMLDCTSTARGIFFGVLIFTGTILSYVLFVVYRSNPDTQNMAKLISEITEFLLLFIALIITCFAFVKVRKHYSKILPELNMFDIVLEIMSLCGVYIFGINSLIAVSYEFSNDHLKMELPKENYLEFLKEPAPANNNLLYAAAVSGGGVGGLDNNPIALVVQILATINSILSIIQATLQTWFILECLRRYAHGDKAYMRKPARDMITALLSKCIYFG